MTSIFFVNPVFSLGKQNQILPRCYAISSICPIVRDMIEDTHEYFCVRTPVHESGRRKAKKWQKHRNGLNDTGKWQMQNLMCCKHGSTYCSVQICRLHVWLIEPHFSQRTVPCTLPYQSIYAGIVTRPPLFHVKLRFAGFTNPISIFSILKFT